jgi:hypothetical protein
MGIRSWLSSICCVSPSKFIEFDELRTVSIQVVVDRRRQPAFGSLLVACVTISQSLLSWMGRGNLCSSSSEVAWWTIAGGRANFVLAPELTRRLEMKVIHDNFVARSLPHQLSTLIEREIRCLADVDPGSFGPPVNGSALDDLKFAECLPNDLATRVVQERLADEPAVAGVLGKPARALILN